MERRGANRPLLMVCSLLSYSDNRLRFCRSWKVLTLRQLILLAFSSLRHKRRQNSICYLSVFVLLFSFISPRAAQTKINTHTVNEIIYFLGCETTTFLSPVVVFPPTISSPVPPCSLVYPLHTLVIIFFLATTHKSENCGFIYFHFLSTGEKRRGTSPVGWERNILF